MPRGIILLTLLTALMRAQETSPLVRSTTRMVLLDVVVSDRSGNPVRSLTQDNFTVLENGKPQKISSFEAPLSAESPVLPNTPRTIILLDELNAGFADLSYARDRILLFLAQNHLERTPTALMTLNQHGLSVLENYTQDGVLLKKRLTDFRPALINPVEGEFQQTKVQEHAQRSINSLLEIAHASLGSPYNLNVIWVTNGFAGTLKDTSAKDGTQNGLRRLANLLMSSRIRLYSIDPGGVHPLDATVVATPGSSKPLSSSNTMPNSHNNDDLASAGPAYEATEFLDKLTAMTGGRAYYGRNDVEIALSQAVNDGAANYLISYSPANSDFNGEYRKIEIRTNQDGLVARTRLGYYAVASDPVPSQDMREARWTAALTSPLTYAALSLTCPLTYDAATGHASGTLTVKPTPLSMQAEPQSQEIIRIAALSSTGVILANWPFQIDWKKTWTNRVTTAAFDKPLPKKTQTVRFLVSDPGSLNIGTCDYRIP
jgi:VWFA-related protein